jgi:ribosomal protein S18 acetylase RimI-like enzyme
MRAVPPDASQLSSDTVIAPGYRPGLIGRVTEMHALYYARETGFGQRFESVVAGGLADLCNRLGNARNEIWSAMRGDNVIGSISIDGEDMGDGIAHLRFFIVGDDARGSGCGRKLLSTALMFADAHEFAETHLWTFQGLSPARHLYESFGFKLVEERMGDQWGTALMEKRFVRARPTLIKRL